MISSGVARFPPGFTCPPFRPEQPQPGSAASSTRTVLPSRARCKAAEQPV